MRASPMGTLTDTLTVSLPVTDTVSVGYRYASLSVAFALLPDASQGGLCIPDTDLPGDQGVFPKSRAAFEMRGGQ
jgi:hypothetical protein